MALILDGLLGETFPSWTTSTRPAAPAPGQVGFNSTTSSLECYSGSAWIPFGSNASGTRTVSTAAPTGGSNGDIWYRY
jgi:hypothetical protein